MANADSRTAHTENNPQRPEAASIRGQSALVLIQHLETVADSITAVQWALATRDFTNADTVDVQVFEVKAMVEALDREFTRLLDHVEFGEAGAVLSWPHIYNSAFHVQGMFYLVLEGLDSIVLAGDAGYPAQGLNPGGVARLLNRAQERYQELCADIVSETGKHTMSTSAAH
jgi:hypothetical protein